MKTKVRDVRFILIVILLVTGAGLFLCPLLSNIAHSSIHKDVISNYETVIDNKNDDEVEADYADAQQYNFELQTSINRFDEVDTERYDSILNNNGDGMIGKVTIDKLGIELPVYHGTSDTTLSGAIGHLEGSSFPVEGKGVHSVLVGHSGMLGESMFTDITNLEIGDIFKVTVSNREIVYQVDNIVTVLPNDLSNLGIDENENYCTLLTCVPYGINSHRLCVRGHEININDYSKEELEVKTNKVLTFSDKFDGILAGIGVIVLSATVLFVINECINVNSKRGRRS